MINFVQFPDVSNCNEDGLLAMGGDLSVDTLVSAYTQGIFPWFNDDQPILWWSPDPRLVLFPDQVKCSRSLRKNIRQHSFTVSCNTQFEQVISRCALRGNATNNEHNTEQSGTWITDSMRQAYLSLHQQGYAHSVEVWQADKLVGGLYGIALGDVFFGESMFSDVSNASKVALVTLCRYLERHHFKVIDCQVSSSHLLSMGAEEISRKQFLSYLSTIEYQPANVIFSNDFSTLGLLDDIKNT